MFTDFTLYFWILDDNVCFVVVNCIHFYVHRRVEKDDRDRHQR